MTTAWHPTSAAALAPWMPPQQRPAADSKPWRHAVLTPAPKESWGERRARYFDECRVGMDCGPDDDQDEGDDFEGAPV